MSRPIRVLIVDDSAFARKVIREILSADPEIEVVGIARDGLDALEKISELSPDVVTLDLVMPDLDGIGVLRSLPAVGAPKVIVVSVSGSETELGLEALALGAIDIVAKPTPLPTSRLYELSGELAQKVKAVAGARAPDPLKAAALWPPPPAQVPTACTAFTGSTKTADARGPARIVVIGTSTGGPHALTEIFRTLPAGLPVPIAIALHIPAGYTGPIAARLTVNGLTQVTEAADRMELLAGRAYISPGGMHLRVISAGGRLFAEVSREPADMLYHPSVDLLFASAAMAVGKGAVGVVLTGMGNDGMLGAQAIQAAGGVILAESASTCVVYGMPRTVIEGGFAKAEAPLDEMSKLIADTVLLDR